MAHSYTAKQHEKSLDDSFPEFVELPLEDVLDLHSFLPKEIRVLVKGYLQDAYEAGFPEVRIIHGKGIGVQREIVRSVAARDPHVQSASQAPEGAGGWGATIIRFYPQHHKKS
jgi:dsDNA-specific endonuclease/ATPase MutS2